MAVERGAMSAEELARYVSGEIDDALKYSEELAPARNKALRFVQGDIDVPREPGKSAATSMDLADVLGWVMPSLMRLFLSSDRVVIYEPKRPRYVPGPDGPKDISDEQAGQATDYVNYVTLTECHGYDALQAAFYNGLLLGNGQLKHWWDESPEYKVEGPYTGLS